MDIRSKPETSSFLRFGVMCGGTSFQYWQSESIRELLANGHQLALLIIDGRKPRKHHFLKRVWNHFGSGFFFHLCHLYCFKPASRLTVDLTFNIADVDIITCQVEKKNKGEYFDPGDIECIRSHNLDFILRFGFNIIRGEILSSARFGIWSFHHDDETLYRGGPAGFWEIYFRDPVNGAILQQLTEELDHGIILKKGYLKTIFHSYSGNLNNLLKITSSWPNEVANEILRTGTIKQLASGKQGPLYKIPGNGKMILFSFRMLWSKIKFYYYELFSAEIWNVGLIKSPMEPIALGEKKIGPADITWLRTFGRGKYLADPSGFIKLNKLHILMEDYSYKKQQAGISEVIWDFQRNSFSVPISTIEGHKHLSYPFIVEDNQRIYCIPESYREGNVRLYKRNFSEEAFMEERILVDNVQAVDPTLFRYGNHWWLFFTTRPNSATHLYIYYADQLLGDYRPHPMNPVKIDIRSSRPAGTPFFSDGELYRPAQDCSVTYGGRVTINKILKLSPDEFEEIPVGVVEPVMDTPYPNGLHTISRVGEYTLIDGKCYRFNYYHFLNQLKRKLSRARKTNV